MISAHPDDMEIGMGGTIAKLAEAGAMITSAVLTDGRRSPNPFSWTEEHMAEVRKKEARNAAAALGVKEVVFFGLPDLKSENNYRLAREKLGELITQIRPTEMYTLHDQIDRHPTHRLAGQLAIENVRETGSLSGSVVWAYEVWGLFPTWDRIEYIDAQVGKKLLAIGEHKSQVASIPYGEGVIGLNRWRAVFADSQETKIIGAFAEVFVSVPIFSSRT